jgi:hypothetical protein
MKPDLAKVLFPIESAKIKASRIGSSLFVGITA